MDVGDIVRLNAVSIPDKIALVCGETRLSYGALNERINRVANALLALGVKAGDRVAMLGYNSSEFVCLYFATAKVGAMLVPMSFWHRAEELRYVLVDCEPVLILHEPSFGGIIAAAAQDLPARPMAVSSERATVAEWEKLVTGMSAAEPPRIDAARHPHMIVYTSGTTGRPKGAIIGQPRTVADALSVSGVLGVRQNDVFINYFPPFHVGNWDHQKLFMIVGATVVLQTQFDAPKALATIEAEGVSVLLGVPAMFNALMNDPAFSRTDLSSLRLIYYAAYDPSGIMGRIADLFRAREGGIEMAHVYGLTEGGAFVTACRSHDVFAHWGSIGRAVPGIEVALIDAEGNRVVGAGQGEICVRGPMMDGYWRRPEETAETLAGGWLHTGDIAEANADGFLWIIDRKKDMIRSGGHNVYSKEVEDTIAQHEAVADTAVIGLDDPVYEELVCAIVVLKPGFTAGDAMADDLREFVRTRKAGYNVPRRIHFLEALPKNAVGKTQKHVLRDEFRKDRAGVGKA
ncbi:MAG: AMP-binding protein [Rhizobiaceae bacterium]|nr:AMP-binding protein [Rhizobiaceae bacterium]